MSGGGCGGCNACCTLMKVEMEPPKPARERCVHCVKGGCAIYEERPEPCRVWSCVWLLSQDKPQRLASALRPDRSGVVLETNSMAYVIAHCRTPSAWKAEPMHGWLLRLAARTRVLIDVAPDEVLLLGPSGQARPLVFAGIDPATNERQYRLETSG